METGTAQEREREEVGRGPFKRKNSECAQEVLLVAAAAAEDLYVRTPRAGQYRHPNPNTKAISSL